MDDPAILLAHIRMAFITSDETGVSELVMESEDNRNRMEKKRSYSFVRRERSPSSPTEVICLSQSPDVVPGMDYGHRCRSNTAQQRIEKMMSDKQKQSRIQHITWKCGENPSKEDLDEMFPTEELKPLSATSTTLPTTPSTTARCTKSRLGQLIEEFDKMASTNPFSAYAKFDGQGMCSTAKTYDVFLTMLTAPAERAFPMSVNISLTNTKVEDLIGLICWKYTTENREPKLIPNVKNYSLNLVEDNGEVDYDFPPLDPHEPVAKFNFNKFALVENDHQSHNDHMDDGGGFIKNDDLDVSHVDVDDDDDHHHHLHHHHHHLHHHHHRPDDDGGGDDGDDLLDVDGSCVSHVGRQRHQQQQKHSLRKSDSQNAEFDKSSAKLYQHGKNKNKSSGPPLFALMNEALSSPSSSSSSPPSIYILRMLHRYKHATDVKLEFKNRHLEISQFFKTPSSSKKQDETISYNFNSISSCYIANRDNKKSNNTYALLRLVVRTAKDGKVKEKSFESDHQSARSIVNRIDAIIHSCNKTS